MSLLIWCLLFASGINATPKEVTLLTAEYPPYSSTKLKSQGALSEIISEAYALVGIKANIIIAPWATAFEQAKDGKYDGLFPVWYTDERTEHFLYSKPFMANQMGFYYEKGRTLDFDSFEDLKPYTIGIVSGYAYPKGFVDAKLKTISVTKDAQNMALLCRGLIDLALTDKIVGMYIVNHRYSECAKKLAWTTAILKQQSNHLVISKKLKNHRLMMAAFNRGLLQLQQQNGVQRILQKHGLDTVSTQNF